MHTFLILPYLLLIFLIYLHSSVAFSILMIDFHHFYFNFSSININFSKNCLSDIFKHNGPPCPSRHSIRSVVVIWHKNPRRDGVLKIFIEQNLKSNYTHIRQTNLNLIVQSTSWGHKSKIYFCKHILRYRKSHSNIHVCKKMIHGDKSFTCIQDGNLKSNMINLPWIFWCLV